MNPFVILYSTREETRRLAEQIEAAVRDRGHSARILDVSETPEPFSLEGFEGAIVAASAHMGKHEHVMVEFVKRHREELAALPTAFLSVSRAGDHLAEPADTGGLIDEFLARTGWRPSRAKAVASARLCSKYNLIIRFIKKRIGTSASMPTDSSREHEYADWDALDRLVDEVLRSDGAGRVRTSNLRPRNPILGGA
jgi:menaquinone-dependent protoporphyrinogen oxidase